MNCPTDPHPSPHTNSRTDDDVHGQGEERGTWQTPGYRVVETALEVTAYALYVR
ncbi:pyrroloquinoline quinone precursor peptide PqqA [Streptomyces sp. NPDC001339]|uniref:pyrroloquinoline quinone precursor peptide PqqA n=1 Tax=Streptomyces sp. NPDC001339 TaxID=3364563 RepID=UPI0036A57B7A